MSTARRKPLWGILMIAVITRLVALPSVRFSMGEATSEAVFILAAAD